MCTQCHYDRHGSLYPIFSLFFGSVAVVCAIGTPFLGPAITTAMDGTATTARTCTHQSARGSTVCNVCDAPLSTCTVVIPLKQYNTTLV